MLVMASSRTDSTSLKRAAAAKALEYVSAGMKLGLGPGSTAEAFLDLLGPRVRGGLHIIAVATSEPSPQRRRAVSGSRLQSLATRKSRSRFERRTPVRSAPTAAVSSTTARLVELPVQRNLPRNCPRFQAWSITDCSWVSRTGF